MELVKKEVIKVFQEKYKGNFSLEDLINFCFETEIIHYRRCEIAVVKKHYADLLLQNPEMKAKEAKTIIAEKFFISESTVENYIYYYRKIKF